MTTPEELPVASQRACVAIAGWGFEAGWWTNAGVLGVEFIAGGTSRAVPRRFKTRYRGAGKTPSSAVAPGGPGAAQFGLGRLGSGGGGLERGGEGVGEGVGVQGVGEGVRVDASRGGGTVAVIVCTSIRHCLWRDFQIGSNLACARAERHLKPSSKRRTICCLRWFCVCCVCCV